MQLSVDGICSSVIPKAVMCRRSKRECARQQVTDDLTLDASKSRKKKGGLGGLERPREVREGK